ncbi:MAG: molecular chaperone HtpG [Desulfovibrionaceae bacterium]|nr:molecular chaperone HtpG [Desulfovibrionaceae bacterium]
MPDTAKTYEFKAEIRQLLDILVHSLYTKKEIFLRELVSNASDALDKYRFATAGEADGDLDIRIALDKDQKTLTVTDTGLGMTRDELAANLGTIAHSGSAEFLKRAAESKQGLDSLIGRFGVGFYSVFMVADEVVVRTRSHLEGEAAMEWKSDGKGGYELRRLDQDLPRGTSVTLRLKDSMAGEFTSPETVKAVIRRHSNFISFPIQVDGERVNTVPALWREPKFQIKPEQYREFYSFLTFDDQEPLETMHVSVDAPVQFNGLLFIPGRGLDLFGLDRDSWGLDLYVKRVLIERQNKDLLPRHLGFVKGVVDTEDLPLNISRETLQDNLLIRKIQTTLTKHVLGHLEKAAKDDAGRYAEFWAAHGQMFKTGYLDFANREAFAGLLRFSSSALDDAKALTSLDEYASRAKEGQKAVFYASCPSFEAAALNPHLEMFRTKGVEVLYLFDPIDEFIMDTLREFKGLALKAAEHAGAADLKDLPDVVKTKRPAKMAKKDQEAFPGFLDRIRDILGDKAAGVRASDRLRQSPCCLASPDGQTTSGMDRIMRVMARDAGLPKKILELNPDHELVRNMLQIYEADPKDPFLEQAAQQLFESAMLLEGFLDDPHALVGRLQDLLTKASAWYTNVKGPNDN